MTYMTFVENGKNDPSKLSLWINKDGNLFIEIEPDGNDDGYQYQCIELGLHDAREFLNEVSRIVKEIEGEREQVPEQQPRLLPTGTGNLFS